MTSVTFVTTKFPTFLQADDPTDDSHSENHADDPTDDSHLENHADVSECFEEAASDLNKGQKCCSLIQDDKDKQECLKMFEQLLQTEQSLDGD